MPINTEQTFWQKTELFVFRFYFMTKGMLNDRIIYFIFTECIFGFKALWVLLFISKIVYSLQCRNKGKSYFLILCHIYQALHQEFNDDV